MPASPNAFAPRARFWYSGIGLVLTLVLVGWGGVVTTIEAGLAVPDWPSSFGSLDPFATGYSDPANADVRWWEVPDILAEHGHRLLGALVGLWVVGLMAWTWIADPRQWMRILTAASLGLVVAQGILGGLRVLWESLDLAIVHAMGAQLVFSTTTLAILPISGLWLRRYPPGTAITSAQIDHQLRTLAVLTAIAVFVQIFLGALLRHRGAGVDLTFVLIHVTGSVVALSLSLMTAARIRNRYASNKLLSRGAWVMIACLIAQMLLGIFALTIILYDATQVARSLAQIVLSSAHLAVGAVLMASVVCVMVCSLRNDVGLPWPVAE
ncbi:MAG: COX15/CtaA family protein [Bacteroidota bacterium]|nr:COX15/CtaA family protein [Bacteroidota bacterium]